MANWSPKFEKKLQRKTVIIWKVITSKLSLQ